MLRADYANIFCNESYFEARLWQKELGLPTNECFFVVSLWPIMQGTMPLISIVTVCYKALESLKKTVQSVLNQEFRDFEYWIIDAASPDGTANYLQGLAAEDTPIKWVSEPDKGIYDAMNKGIRRAEGSYILFMNAGDLFVNTSVLNRIKIYLEQNAALVYGDYVVQNTRFKELVKAESLQSPWLGMKFCHQSTFMRRDIALRYPFSGHYITSDFEQIFAIYCAGEPFVYAPFPVAIFMHDGLSTKNKLKIRLESQEIVQKQDKMTSETARLFGKLILRTRLIEWVRAGLPNWFFELLYMLKIRFLGSKKSIYKD